MKHELLPFQESFLLKQANGDRECFEFTGLNLEDGGGHTTFEPQFPMFTNASQSIHTTAKDELVFVTGKAVEIYSLKTQQDGATNQVDSDENAISNDIKTSSEQMESETNNESESSQQKTNVEEDNTSDGKESKSPKVVSVKIWPENPRYVFYSTEQHDLNVWDSCQCRPCRSLITGVFNVARNVDISYSI